MQCPPPYLDLSLPRARAARPILVRSHRVSLLTLPPGGGRREASHLGQSDFVLSSDSFIVLARYIILYFGSNVRLTLELAGCISGSQWYSCHSQAVSVFVPVDVGQRAHPAENCVRETETVWVKISLRGFNGGIKVERDQLSCKMIHKGNGGGCSTSPPKMYLVTDKNCYCVISHALTWLVEEHFPSVVLQTVFSVLLLSPYNCGGEGVRGGR